MDLLERLLGHDHWATEQLLTSSQGLTDAQLDQEFDIGHRTVRATCDHMIFITEFWTLQLAGEPVDTGPDGDRPVRSVNELLERHEQSYAAFAALARRVIDEGRLDETFTDYFGYPQSLGTTIVNVFMHNQQHRTEALHVLRRLGVSDLLDGDPQEWEYEIQSEDR